MSERKAEMTSRQRMLAALRREPVDYVPCSPSFNPLSEVQRRGRKWEFPWGEDSGWEQLEYCVTELGLDMVVNCGVGGYEMDPEVSCEVWQEGPILHKAYATPAGELRSAVTYDDRWPHGMDIPFFSDFNPGHATKFWIESERDLECFSYIMRPPDKQAGLEASRAHVEAARETADQYQLATMCNIGSGLTGALQMFGPANLCVLTVDRPEWIHRYLELDHEVNLRSIEIAMELGVDIVRRNGFYETSDLYSPAMLEDFLFDRLQAEIRLVQQAGKLTTYTVHTGVMPMLDYLRRLDFDCLMDIDIVFKDTDLAAVRDSQDWTKSFWLGPSSTFHLYNDDPEVTRQAVRDCFEVLGKEGLIIRPSCSAHSIMPWESTLAMIDEWRKLR